MVLIFLTMKVTIFDTHSMITEMRLIECNAYDCQNKIKYFLWEIAKYSQTCVQRLPSGPKKVKGGRCSEVIYVINGPIGTSR